MNKTITIETIIEKDIQTVWKMWNTGEDIQNWMHAGPDWECPKASNDLKTGGRFSFTLAAKDKSTSFDFTGVYTAVDENQYIAYTADDGRTVVVTFEEVPEGVYITETFEMETVNPEEMQRSGWQAILDNFKAYVENQ